MKIDTLKDLADHCYQQWLTTNRTDLPSGAIGWLRDSPVEPPLAGQIGEIFAADIEPSEKCYRFLKLTGVIERERLIQLLRKQILDELDNEKEQKLREVEDQWQARVEEQRQRIFNTPDDTSFSLFWFVITVSIVFGFITSIVAHNLTGKTPSGDNPVGISADIGWRVGLLIGAIAAYGYRRIRANTLTEQFRISAKEGIESQKKGIEEGIRDRKVNVDADILQLIKEFSLSLTESADNQKNSHGLTSATRVVVKTSHKYRYTGLAVAVGLLLIFSPSYILSKSSEYSSTPSAAPTPSTASTPVPEFSAQFDQMISKRLDEIGNEIKRGNYKLASLKMQEIFREYPDVADRLSGANLSWLFGYKAKIYQHTGDIAKDTFIVEGTVTRKTEMEGSGAYWDFTLQDLQGKEHDFGCSRTSVPFFNIDDKKIDFVDGYDKLKDAYDKVRLYIWNADSFDKYKNAGCPAGIVMFTN